MIARGTALKVARLAAEVLANPHTRARLADGYTRIDPIAIAEDEGINVMVRPLDKLLGAFLREDSVGILLNHRRPAGMFHMTCAHELGHFFLGHGTNTDEQIDYGSGANEIELEADQFAYSLMAPLALVVKVLNPAPELPAPRQTLLHALPAPVRTILLHKRSGEYAPRSVLRP